MIESLVQIGELLLAFTLCALVGLERTIHGKGAGLRTQSIVGVASALFFQVGAYGFPGSASEDPSRVAAQVVSGVGFLGAGLIITQHSKVRGLTTAASVWESAAIGMAAAASLWYLALAVTGLHFVITYGLKAITDRITAGRPVRLRVRVAYADGRGLLRALLARITGAGWTVVSADPRRSDDLDQAAVVLEIQGTGGAQGLLTQLADMDGVASVEIPDEDEFD